MFSWSSSFILFIISLSFFLISQPQLVASQQCSSYLQLPYNEITSTPKNSSIWLFNQNCPSNSQVQFSFLFMMSQNNNYTAEIYANLNNERILLHKIPAFPYSCYVSGWDDNWVNMPWNTDYSSISVKFSCINNLNYPFGNCTNTYFMHDITCQPFTKCSTAKSCQECTGATNCGYCANLGTCQYGRGVNLPGDGCATGSWASTSSSCASVLQYNWITSSWSNCDASCSQSRTTYCLGTDGKNYTDRYCMGVRPTTFQYCTSGGCTCGIQVNDLPNSQMISLGTNTIISIQCGVGKIATIKDLQIKTPGGFLMNYCISSTYNSITSSGSMNCLNTTSPATNVDCLRISNYTIETNSSSLYVNLMSASNLPFKVNYSISSACKSLSWNSSSWSICASGCTQDRNVTCQDGFGKIYSPSLCNPSTKPTVSQSCTNGNCIIFNWEISIWNACTTSCNNRTRTVYCRGSDNKQYNDSYCQDQGVKPIDTENCFHGMGSCFYRYESTPWSNCSSACVRNSSYFCLRSDNVKVDDSYCSIFSTKPATSEACAAGTGSCVFSWVPTQWNLCTYSCDQTRGAYCALSTGTKYPDSYCSHLWYPINQRKCTDGYCTFSWYVDNFRGCNSTCMNQGVLYCEGSDQLTYNYSFCGSIPKPNDAFRCIGGACSMHWVPSAWDICGSSCTQTRSISCADFYGTVHSDSYCLAIGSGAGPKPAISQSCRGGYCKSYAWKYDNWTNCSSSCSHSRTVICQAIVGNVNWTVSDSYCSAQPKPISIESCNGDACVPGSLSSTFDVLVTSYSDQSCQNMISTKIHLNNACYLLSQNVLTEYFKVVCMSPTMSSGWTLLKYSDSSCRNYIGTISSGTDGNQCISQYIVDCSNNNAASPQPYYSSSSSSSLPISTVAVAAVGGLALIIGTVAGVKYYLAKKTLYKQHIPLGSL